MTDPAGCPVSCVKCKRPLTQQGPLIWRPPVLINEQGFYHRKYHVCCDCFERSLVAWMGLAEGTTGGAG